MKIFSFDQWPFSYIGGIHDFMDIDSLQVFDKLPVYEIYSRLTQSLALEINMKDL
jgi:hypothetical protein